MFDRKKWYEENKDWLLEKHKIYWHKNKEYFSKKHKEWCQKNRDHLKEYRANWYQKNKERILENRKENYYQNRQKRIDYSIKWNKEHPQKKKQYSKIWKQNHLEEYIEYNKQWGKNNPEKVKAKNQRNHYKRKIFISSSLNTLTDQEWFEILNYFNYHCAYCNCKFSKDNPPTRDHLIPVNKGGHNIKENIVPACKSCNSKKYNKLVLSMI
jgi:hypothetical protein